MPVDSPVTWMLTGTFTLVEIDLVSSVPSEALAPFAKELAARQRRHERQQALQVERSRQEAAYEASLATASAAPSAAQLRVSCPSGLATMLSSVLLHIAANVRGWCQGRMQQSLLLQPCCKTGWRSCHWAPCWTGPVLPQPPPPIACRQNVPDADEHQQGDCRQCPGLECSQMGRLRLQTWRLLWRPHWQRIRPSCSAAPPRYLRRA